jgi:Tol biopolymer transport system component
MNADGSNQNSYYGSSYFYNHMIGRIVNWSPDGTKLVFNSTEALDGNPGSPDVYSLNIWIMNADGSGRQALTQYSGTLTSNNVSVYVPTWSPDGSKIAFLSSGALDGSEASGTGWCIWTVNADGSGLAPLTATATGLGWNTYWLQPAWQP